MPEACRVSCPNKFGKLVHLVGFIIKKFVTMHGHTNVKFSSTFWNVDESSAFSWELKALKQQI